MDKQNIYQDTFDGLVFEDIKNQSPKIRERIKKGQELLTLFPELEKDIFAALYKNDPQLVPEAPYGTQLNRKQLETFMEDSRFDTIRGYTVYDDFSAAAASCSIMDEVIVRLEEDEELKKLVEKQNEMQGQKDEEKKNQMQSQLETEIEKASSKIRQALKQGIKKAEKEAEENEEAFAALGCGKGDTELKRLSFKEKTDLLKSYGRVKQMAQYIGKYKSLAVSARTARIKSTKSEISGVTMGGNITRALPHELVALRHPVLKYNFYRKLQEHQIMQYEMEHKEDVGRGPIVCLLDDSGSMYDENAYIARGVAFGLLQCAKADKRNFGLYIFSGENSFKTFIIEKGEATPEQCIDILSVSLKGGTSYSGPMRWGLHQCEQQKFKNGDIVMITDGLCELPPNTKEQVIAIKKEQDIKITVIMIGERDYSKQIRDWADVIYKDMGEENIEEIYKAVQ